VGKAFGESHSDPFGERNPLHGEAGAGWAKLIDALGPASLIVIINRRMEVSLRRKVAAEDVLQDALLLAWRDRAQCDWRGLRSFRSWLLTLIDHRIVDLAKHHAAAKRDSSVPVLSLAGPAAFGMSDVPMEVAASTTPSRLGIHREQAQRMQAALDSLPEDHRTVVFMRLFEQRTVSQIAAMLGTTEKTVRYRFYKGAELFRARLRTLVSSRWTRRAESGAEPAGEIASEDGES